MQHEAVILRRLRRKTLRREEKLQHSYSECTLRNVLKENILQTYSIVSAYGSNVNVLYPVGKYLEMRPKGCNIQQKKYKNLWLLKAQTLAEVLSVTELEVFKKRSLIRACWGITHECGRRTSCVLVWHVQAWLIQKIHAFWELNIRNNKNLLRLKNWHNWRVNGPSQHATMLPNEPIPLSDNMT